MIEHAAKNQTKYLHSKPETDRKSLGQFYTGAPVADYMASLLSPVNAPVVKVLDAGAGAGILTMAVAFRCLENGNEAVHAVLYEIDDHVIGHLTRNMNDVAAQFQRCGASFTYEIRQEDFVLARPDLEEERFQLSSINPPYFKYNSKTSPYSAATTDLYKGNPNIYASFMAIVSNCLGDDGQMVAIVPRSFTNGLYFKGFRHFLNSTLSLDDLHVFGARNKVFKDLSVLQENVICHYSRASQQPNINIHTSSGYEDLNRTGKATYPAQLIIDTTNDQEIIRIPENHDDGAILKFVESWPSRFAENGYFISTGPVVEHRARNFIVRPETKVEAVPLLRMHNVKAFATEWTGVHKKDAMFELKEGHEKHTSVNEPYVLLKRFSSKDERRRLVASVHDPGQFSNGLIGLENHLNYIGRKDRDFSREEAFGMAVLFNSTLVDRYFRCISGNTQVNATEIRLLRLPSRKSIRLLGEAFLQSEDSSQEHVDRIVEQQLQVRNVIAA